MTDKAKSSKTLKAHGLLQQGLLGLGTRPGSGLDKPGSLGGGEGPSCTNDIDRERLFERRSGAPPAPR